MCGFSGFISIHRFSALCEEIPKSVLSLSHRGPNDSGLYFDRENGVGLGHRRLSVIDLSKLGRQPMGSDDGGVHIAYNGEVYNFRKIRRTLEEYGLHFTSSTDTEVALKSYLHWGIDCFKHFIGMFSMAIWDKDKKRLLLTRDRLGIKSLYYYFSNGILLFSSELKGLMAFKDFKRQIDMKALPLFFPSAFFRESSSLEV